MDSVLSIIDSELESGIDVSFCEMLYIMKTFGNAGCTALAVKIEEELQLDQEKQAHPSLPLEFSNDDRVEDMFLQLVPAVGEILKMSGCEFSILRSACIKPDTPLANVNKLPSVFLDKINATRNLNELLALLIGCPYCNWMNVRMLEKMVAASRQGEAKNLIAKYKDVVFSKKVTDVLQDFPDLEISEDFYTKVWDKWKKDLKDITVKDITDRWIKLQKIFDVENLELLLDNIIKGSIIIVWLIPTELKSLVRQSALENWGNLGDVSFLKIGDHVIKDDQITGELLLQGN